MRYNTGKIDRTLRVLVAFIILSAGFYYQSLWGLTGVIFLVSGITGFCPLYAVFGISTCHYDVVSEESKGSLNTKI